MTVCSQFPPLRDGSIPPDDQTTNSGLPSLQDTTTQAPKKRKRRTKQPIEADNALKTSSDLPDPTKPSTSMKRAGKKETTSASTSISSKGASKGVAKPEVAAAKRATGTSACLECRQKKLDCDRNEPTCHKCCQRHMACHFETKATRSKTGCLLCRAKKRKCDEEKPSCGYCTRIDSSCEYP